MLTDRPPATPALTRAPTIVLSAREAREYRLGTALLALADHEVPSGLAWEVSETLARALPAGASRLGGLLVPHSIEVAGEEPGPHGATRAGLDSATSSKGAELKFTEPGPLIDLLRKKAIVLRLGATELEGLRGDVAFPRLTGGSTPSWTTENAGSDVSASDPTLDRAVTLTPRTIIGATSFSRQLLALSQASVGVDRLVRRDIALNHAVAIDAGAIAGSGSAGQPTGIVNTSGIGLVAGGTNGAQPTWANVCALEMDVANANADTDPAGMGYATTPVLRNTLRTKDRGGTSTGWFIMSDAQTINGYPVAVSNSVPSTLTKGTSVGVCHAIVFGLWPELLVGMWGAFELLADPLTLKKQGMIEVTSIELVDIAVRHAVSFAAMLDALQ